MVGGRGSLSGGACQQNVMTAAPMPLPQALIWWFSAMSARRIVFAASAGAGRTDGMNLSIISRIRRNGQDRPGVSTSTADGVTSTGWRTSVWLRALPRWRAGKRAGPCAGAAGASSQAEHVTGQQLAATNGGGLRLTALMGRVVGPGHHHHRTRCHLVRGGAVLVMCVHKPGAKAEAEVELSFDPRAW